MDDGRGIERIGSLDDDMTALSARVAQRLWDGPMIVWTEESDVYCAPRDQMSIALAGDIVGSYAQGHLRGEIQDDFQVLLRERAKDDLLD